MVALLCVKGRRADADTDAAQGIWRQRNPRDLSFARDGRNADAARDQGQRGQPGQQAGLVRSHPAGLAGQGPRMDVFRRGGQPSRRRDFSARRRHTQDPRSRMIRLSQEEGGLWIATIDRPEKANSLTARMLEELCDIAEDALTGARALVLTGTGKVFSAGADLEAAKAGLAVSPLWERLSGAIARHPGLTVCALNGTVAGGAMGMALACDLRVSVAGAKLFYPVMKLGFLPQPSDPERLRALIGPSRAKMILMAGRKVPVEEALSWGLIDSVVTGELLGEVRAMAADTLGAEAGHARAIKGLIGGI